MDVFSATFNLIQIKNLTRQKIILDLANQSFKPGSTLPPTHQIQRNGEPVSTLFFGHIDIETVVKEYTARGASTGPLTVGPTKV